jgi:hypothetical protein
MLVGACRAVLGVQDCEIEWTSGILSLVLITLDIIVLGTDDRVSLLFIHCIQQLICSAAVACSLGAESLFSSGYLFWVLSVFERF